MEAMPRKQIARTWRYERKRNKKTLAEKKKTKQQEETRRPEANANAKKKTNENILQGRQHTNTYCKEV